MLNTTQGGFANFGQVPIVGMRELIEDQILVLLGGCTRCHKVLVDEKGQSVEGVRVSYENGRLGKPYCKDCFPDTH